MIARPAIAVRLWLLVAFSSFAGFHPVHAANSPHDVLDANGVWKISSTPPLVPQPLVPPARSSSVSVWCPGHDFMLMDGGIAGSTSLSDVWALTPAHHPSWQQILPSGSAPAARNKHSAIYDPLRDRVVFFGGTGSSGSLNDVWALSLSGPPQWSQILPAGTAPSPRMLHSAIYDSHRDRMIVFGGRAGTLSGEVWALDFSGTPTWSKIVPTGVTPGGRAGMGAVYDAARDRMVIYGGVKGAGISIETWALDFSTQTWAMLDSAGGNAWTATIVAVDSMRDRMLSFDGGLHAFDFATSTWADVIPGAPEISTNSIVYDPEDDTAILYGVDGSGAALLSVLSVPLRWVAFPIPTPGYTSSPMFGNSGVYDPVRDQMLMWDRADQNAHIWSFDVSGLSAWSYVTFTGHPPGIRRDHRMVIDRPRDRLVLFGGWYLDDPNVVFNDVWQCPIAGPFAWQRINTIGTPPVGRYRGGVIYDPIRDRLVVTGGITHTGVASDTWVLSLGDATWTLLSPTGTPPPGGACNAVYDAVSDRMIVACGSGEWALSLGASPSWSQLSNSPAPGLSIALDAQRDRVLAVNDDPGGTAAGLQVWSFGLADSSGWSQLATSGTKPQGRQGCTAIFDPRQDRMFITGGEFFDGLSTQRVNGDYFLEFGAPESDCASATQVVSFTPGAGTSWPFPDDALGAPDYYPLTLGTGGSVTLRLDHPVEDRPGIDLYVLENGHMVGDIDENYRVEGSPDGVSFTPLGDAGGGAHGFDLEGSGLAGARYLRITDLPPTETAAFGMAGADIDAVEVVHCATTTDVPQTPAAIARSTISMVRPNPARGAQVFEVRIAAGEPARTLTIYSAAGRRIWHRDLEGLAPGLHWLVWDGLDGRGHPVAASIYFARLETSTGAAVRRVVRIE